MKIWRRLFVMAGPLMAGQVSWLDRGTKKAPEGAERAPKDPDVTCSAVAVAAGVQLSLLQVAGEKSGQLHGGQTWTAAPWSTPTRPWSRPWGLAVELERGLERGSTMPSEVHPEGEPPGLI